MRKNTHVAIIGGGCAGLSTAVALLDLGYQVTLFEASRQLGGRARTVLVENNSLMHLLDNGQHILLGAYRETLALLRKVGVDEHQSFLRLPLQINMQTAPTKSVFLLKSAHYLPAPLNMLLGLLTCSGLSLLDKMAAIQWMAALKKSQYQITIDTPLAQYLLDHKQTAKLITMLWEPLCLAALNTPIAIASTRVFLNVLKDSFSGAKSNSDFLLPKLDLSKILAQPLAQYIQSNGGTIHLNRRVRSIAIVGEGFGLETREGQSTFSHVVLAVPAARLEVLIDNLPSLTSVLQQVHTYSYQPIYTIYLQYPPETILPSVISGLADTLGQWVFDRGQLCAQRGLIAVIISTKGEHQLLNQDELALAVAKALSQAFTQLAKPLWHKVIAEKRATFSCTPNLARPSNRTAQPNLFLAGDYTYADYPATIEGAVRSGIICADLIANK